MAPAATREHTCLSCRETLTVTLTASQYKYLPRLLVFEFHSTQLQTLIGSARQCMSIFERDLPLSQANKSGVDPSQD
jgi:hypothetical protein